MINYKNLLSESVISTLSVGAGILVGYYICSSELLGKTKATTIAAVASAYATTATISSTLRNCRNAVVEIKKGGK